MRWFRYHHRYVSAIGTKQALKVGTPICGISFVANNHNMVELVTWSRNTNRPLTPALYGLTLEEVDALSIEWLRTRGILVD